MLQNILKSFTLGIAGLSPFKSADSRQLLLNKDMMCPAPHPWPTTPSNVCPIEMTQIDHVTIASRQQANVSTGDQKDPPLPQSKITGFMIKRDEISAEQSPLLKDLFAGFHYEKDRDLYDNDAFVSIFSGMRSKASLGHPDYVNIERFKSHTKQFSHVKYIKDPISGETYMLNWPQIQALSDTYNLKISTPADYLTWEAKNNKVSDSLSKVLFKLK